MSQLFESGGQSIAASASVFCNTPSKEYSGLIQMRTDSDENLCPDYFQHCCKNASARWRRYPQPLRSYFKISKRHLGIHTWITFPHPAHIPATQKHATYFLVISFFFFNCGKIHVTSNSPMEEEGACSSNLIRCICLKPRDAWSKQTPPPPPTKGIQPCVRFWCNYLEHVSVFHVMITFKRYFHGKKLVS